MVDGVRPQFSFCVDRGRRGGGPAGGALRALAWPPGSRVGERSWIVKCEEMLSRVEVVESYNTPPTPHIPTLHACLPWTSTRSPLLLPLQSIFRSAFHVRQNPRPHDLVVPVQSCLFFDHLPSTIPRHSSRHTHDCFWPGISERGQTHLRSRTRPMPITPPSHCKFLSPGQRCRKQHHHSS